MMYPQDGYLHTMKFELSQLLKQQDIGHWLLFSTLNSAGMFDGLKIGVDADSHHGSGV